MRDSVDDIFAAALVEVEVEVVESGSQREGVEVGRKKMVLCFI